MCRAKKEFPDGHVTGAHTRGKNFSRTANGTGAHWHNQVEPYTVTEETEV